MLSQWLLEAEAGGAPPARAPRRTRCCGWLCALLGGLLLALSLLASGLSFYAIGTAVRVSTAAQAMLVAECNATSRGVISRRAHCSGSELRQAVAPWVRWIPAEECFAPQWQVRMGSAGDAPTRWRDGRATGSDEPARAAALQALQAHQLGVRLPCLYDPTAPDVAHWTTAELDQLSSGKMALSAVLGCVGLSAAVLAGAALRLGIRRLRRPLLSGRWQINAPPGARPRCSLLAARCLSY